MLCRCSYLCFKVRVSHVLVYSTLLMDHKVSVFAQMFIPPLYECIMSAYHRYSPAQQGFHFLWIRAGCRGWDHSRSNNNRGRMGWSARSLRLAVHGRGSYARSKSAYLRFLFARPNGYIQFTCLFMIANDHFIASGCSVVTMLHWSLCTR